MKSFLVLALLTSTWAFASEVDQFTKRYEPLEDVATIINAKANDYLELAIKAHNESSSTCDETKLYSELKVYFSNHKHGHLVRYILHDEALPKRRFKVKDSIYADFSVLDGYLLGKKSADESEVALGPLLRMGERTIGSDKFEHLFGRGFVYFTLYYLEGKNIDRVLSKGEFGERTVYGGTRLATGVYSFADLTANFNGMRFWNNMLSLRPDILGKSYGPYIKCKNDRYAKVKNIDFLEYFDDGFDEAINCSRFASGKAAKKLKAKLNELKNNDPDHEYTCPVDSSKIPALVEKYKEFAPRLINLEGHRKR
ncbi:MAG: hypothetical protein ACOYL6_16465 [Bacteriovoracaceae bacterium]